MQEADGGAESDVPKFEGSLPTNGASGVPAPANANPAAADPGAGSPQNTPQNMVPTTPGNEAQAATDFQTPPAATQTGGTQTGGTGGSPGESMPPSTPPEMPSAGVPPNTPPSEPPASDPTGGASAGCGRAAGIPANPAVPNTIVTFPPNYNGSTPLPLVFAFHGAGRTNTDMRTVDARTNGSVLENTYVLAYVKSAGNAWDLATDYPRFEAVLDQMLSQFCIDTDHLFAFGHSSGAQFIAQMLGDSRTRETRFAAVAPVSSSRFNNPNWAPVPTLLIHGLKDAERPNDSNGAIDITQYTDSNQCTGGTQPLNVPSCNSLAGGVAVNAGCVQYAGCAAPTLFCNHNDPNYIENGNPTNHGWPCFATSQIFAFFEAQR
jgi:polyhydroxybutyrate depolymerase